MDAKELILTIVSLLILAGGYLLVAFGIIDLIIVATTDLTLESVFPKIYLISVGVCLIPCMACGLVVGKR